MDKRQGSARQSLAKTRALISNAISCFLPDGEPLLVVLHLKAHRVRRHGKSECKRPSHMSFHIIHVIPYSSTSSLSCISCHFIISCFPSILQAFLGPSPGLVLEEARSAKGRRLRESEGQSGRTNGLVGECRAAPSRPAPPHAGGERFSFCFIFHAAWHAVHAPCHHEHHHHHRHHHHHHHHLHNQHVTGVIVRDVSPIDSSSRTGRKD